MNNRWSQKDIPDLTGKVIVVTGANSGLGLESAKTFAEKGATVVMTARNMTKGEKARADILQAHPGATVDLMKLDVGNLASVTDAENHVTAYDYDDMGRLVRTVSPDTGTTRYTYDEAGNPRFKTHNGRTTEYRYDLLGRLTDIIYSDPAQNVTMTYDSGPGANLLGRLASVTDPSGLVQYSYDTAGNQVWGATKGGYVFKKL